MENNKEELRDKIAAEGAKDTEVFSFGYLVNVILDYYHSTSSTLDSSETWKKGTELEDDDNTKIPKDIDLMIKKGFKNQLKKFVK